jgi:hypothetical protein
VYTSSVKVGWRWAARATLVGIVFVLSWTSLSCDDADELVATEDPALIAMCTWVADLGESAVVTTELTEESLAEVADAAAQLGADGRRVRLRGDAQERFADAVFVVEFIRDAANDPRGLISIPTYRQLLSQRLDGLIAAVRDEYGLAPGVAPCAGLKR